MGLKERFPVLLRVQKDTVAIPSSTRKDRISQPFKNAGGLRHDNNLKTA
jgi:hypothetical protein